MTIILILLRLTQIWKPNKVYIIATFFSYIMVDVSLGHSPVNLYVGQVVYEVESQTEWLMTFLVSQHLDALLKVHCCYKMTDLTLLNST